MPDITELRALLRDRQQKEQLGRESYFICLDPDLVREHTEAVAERDDLQADVDDAAKQSKKDARLAPSKPNPETRKRLEEFDQRIDDLAAKIKAATIRLEFRALTTVRYNALLAEHPDANEPDGFGPFCDELAEQCFKGCYRGDSDQKEDLDLSEIREGLTFGEYEPIQTLVLALNRRKVDVPFSPKRSARTAR
jgi:hypothetical protein